MYHAHNHLLDYYHYLQKKHIPGTEIYLNLIQKRLDLLKEHEIRLIEVDVRDYKFINYLLNNTPCDTLIHLAAVAHANKSNKDPYSTFDHSIRTLENTLDIARTDLNDLNRPCTNDSPHRTRSPGERAARRCSCRHPTRLPPLPRRTPRPKAQ